jgi:hypothetical protein
MGTQQSTSIRILAQDAKFGDIFTRLGLAEYSCINYLIGPNEIFEGNTLLAKQALLNAMNIPLIKDTPTLFTNGNGKSELKDIKKFTEIVKEDLKPIVDTDGYTIQLVLTGQCAPLVNIISNLLRDSYVTPAKVEIFVINNEYNGQGLFTELLYLDQVTHNMATTLVIHEFGEYDSMGKGMVKWIDGQIPSKCETSDNFNQQIFELAEKDNVIANGIIQYAIKMNQSITAIVSKINETIKCFDELNIDHNLVPLVLNVDSYIKNLFGEIVETTLSPGADTLLPTTYTSTINIDVCQRLSVDLQKIAKLAENELANLADDKTTSKIQHDEHYKKVKLNQIQQWYQTKTDLTRCNFLNFQFHELAAVLMYTLHPSLVEYVLFGVETDGCFDIVKETPDGPNVKVVHYVASEPKELRIFMEDMLIEMIKAPLDKK